MGSPEFFRIFAETVISGGLHEKVWALQFLQAPWKKKKKLNKNKMLAPSGKPVVLKAAEA